MSAPIPSRAAALAEAMPPSTRAAPFETFSPSHLAAIAAIAFLAVGLPLLARKAGSPRLTRAIAWVLAAALVGNELAYYAHGLTCMSLSEFARQRLPVHVCGAAVFLTAWALCRRSPHAYEVAYYWGLGGTTQAVLTPNLLEAFPSYEFLRYFVNHGAIVIGVLFATLAMRLRPRRGSVLRVIVISQLAMGLVAGVNALLGANYMFLCEPPTGASPFFFLPWPWYVVFLELVGMLVIALLYAPFFLTDRLRLPARPS